MLNSGEIVLRVSFVYFLWWEERCLATATVAETSAVIGQQQILFLLLKAKEITLEVIHARLLENSHISKIFSTDQLGILSCLCTDQCSSCFCIR